MGVIRERLPRGVAPAREGTARAEPTSGSARPGNVATSGAAEMLALQRRVGNRLVVSQLGRMQAKLMVGAANDPAERQADEVAQQVMRHLSGGGASEMDEIEAEEPVVQRAVLINRATAPVGLDGGEVSSELASAIASERGGGHPLPPTVRQPFERAFGTDLSDVRVHHGERSTELNRAVSARAFTLGSDIFLGASQYRPESKAGQELLAHEVTHTIQQRR